MKNLNKIIWGFVLAAAAVLLFPQMNCNGKFDLDQENADDFKRLQVLQISTEGNKKLDHNVHGKSKGPADEIRGPFGANSKSSYVETVIVIDNNLFRSFLENIASINRYCKDLISLVNSIYSSLNLFVILTDVVVWTENDKIKISNDSGQTLDNFLNFREKKLGKNHPSDLGIFLTNHTFDNAVIGKAYIKAICLKKRSAVVVSKHSLDTALVASTIAHEIGHVLGMIHDENVPGCKCYTEKCIMSEVVHLKPIIQWSICSKKRYLKSLSEGLHFCLNDRPKKIFDSSNSYCGNGFVEPGEECDCGLASACKNKCCNPQKCKLSTNALCGSGKCCDLNTCQIKRSGHQCRNSNDECDLGEYCNGISEFCPQDIHKKDGTTCEYGTSYCFQGVCGSRQKQCQILWGVNAVSKKQCYNLNVRGNKYGHCGTNLISYEACKEEDKQCGLLQCTRIKLKENLLLETKIYPIKHIMPRTYYLLHNDVRLPCITAELELEGSNPGLTPNGAGCGHNKMCINQKCVHRRKINTPKVKVSNSSFTSSMPIKVPTKDAKIIEKTTFKIKIKCVKDCYGNGECKESLKCECFDGYLPPFCEHTNFDYDHDDINELNGTFPDVKVIFNRDNPCSDNCNDSGICNEKGVCECFEGFEPPFCIENNENSNFDKLIYVILCCIIFVISVLVSICVGHSCWVTMKKHNEEADHQIIFSGPSNLEIPLDTIADIRVIVSCVLDPARFAGNKKNRRAGF